MLLKASVVNASSWVDLRVIGWCIVPVEGDVVVFKPKLWEVMSDIARQPRHTISIVSSVCWNEPGKHRDDVCGAVIGCLLEFVYKL